MSPARRFAPLALFGLPLAVQLAGYWPGLITWDSIRQYGQALSGDYDDWHPPVMEWIWSKLIPIAPGPAPMLILQLVLYWSGLAALAAQCLAERRRVAFAGIVLLSILPIPLALMGTIVKDSLMTGALVAATGLLAWRRRSGAWVGIAGIALLVFAATLRFNAWPACLPLMLALLPDAATRNKGRIAVSVAAGLAVLLVAMPLANRLLSAKRSGVELSLIIFDLGGITRFSGKNQFPDVDVRDPVAVNRHCYSPVKWDPYSWWVEEPCPIGFESVGDAFQDTGDSPVRWWIKSVASHPFAYLRHRAEHFNINARLFVPDEIERPVTDHDPPNDWHFRLPGTKAQRIVDAGALATGPTPLGWPVVWMAVGLGVLLSRPQAAGPAIPLAASALLYGLSYFPTSVAAELRYHLWTMIGTGLALAFTVDALARKRAGLRQWGLLSGPAVAVTILCAAARLSG